MEKIIKQEGIIYTQRDDVPMDERVFFSQGLVATMDNFRIATPEEVAAWEEWKKKEEEKSISDLN